MGALGKLNLLLSACMRCRTLVDTNVLLYILCCSVQGRLQAILLGLRYVDTAAVAIGAWFVPSWCAQKKKGSKTKLNKKKGEKKKRKIKKQSWDRSGKNNFLWATTG